MSSKRNILVVLGHPNSDSYCQALFDTYVGALNRDSSEVATLELGRLDFDPVLRHGYQRRMEPDPVIERSQELVKWADHIVFIFPCWWEAVPSLLKGWLDRVFTPGFAYEHENIRLTGLLTGRTASVIATYDGPPWWFWLRGTAPSRHLKITILAGSGIKVTRILEQGGMRDGTEKGIAQRQRFLRKVAAIAGKQ